VVPERHEDRPPALRSLFGHVALLLPLAVAVFASSAGSDFRDDLAAVKGLGLVPLGSEGWLTTVLAQLGALAPVGGRWLRAAWVSALALGLCSRLLYEMGVRLLARGADMPRLGPALSLAAALMTVLSPSWQAEGSVIGGATVGVAVILLALDLDRRFAAGDARRTLLFGLLLGLATAESHAAGLSLLGSGVALGVASRRLPAPRALALGCGAFAFVMSLVTLGGLVRSLSPNAPLDLGAGIGETSLTMLDASAARRTAFEAWLGDVGVVSFGLALVGVVGGVAAKPLRPTLLAFLAFVFADLALPEQRIGVLAPDPFAATRLCATAALGLFAAVGVQQVVAFLERARLPFSRPAAVMLVAFNFTLVLGASESSAQADQGRRVAAETFTDQALSSLAPNSLLVARSEALIHRLLAAQLLNGERPDVLVVPAPLLERGSLRRRLLATEPELGPLLREMALRGEPGEFALSELSDARPLYVEFDPAWDPRLFAHLGPRAFFIRYSPHPLGHSDRRAALQKGEEGFDRVIAALGDVPSKERATRAVVISLLRERARLFEAVHDTQALALLLDRLTVLDPQDSVLRELSPKLPRRVAEASKR
jgi:hypothetical protein